VEPPTVQVDIHAIKPVRVTINADGRITFQGIIHRNEARSFDGNDSIQIHLESGGVATITVNGHPIGKPGTPGVPLTAQYTPDSFRGSPSPSGP
jgi:uncharacterized protein DUF4115